MIIKMNPGHIIEVKPPPIQNQNKIIIEEGFEEKAIEMCKKMGGSEQDVESLKNSFPNFKKDIQKMNDGEMEYATMRTLYG